MTREFTVIVEQGDRCLVGSVNGMPGAHSQAREVIELRLEEEGRT